jgi:hypothetical protein
MAYQIDDTYAAAADPGIPADNVATPGFFQGAVIATGQAATRIRFWWLNMVQMEICNVVTGAGIALQKGNNAQLLAAIRAIAAYVPHFTNEQTFSASGTFTVPAGVGRVKLRLYGGGGGGGYGNSAGGGGGGGGGYVEGFFSTVPGDVLTITIGGGGSGGSSGAVATAGGDSTIYHGGELCYATGGQSGAAGTNAGLGAGGAPGVGAGTTFASFGSVGGAGSATSSVIIGGQGGNAFGYQGGPFTMLAFGNNGPGNNAQIGSGGSGGIGMGYGGSGGSGFCVVEY